MNITFVLVIIIIFVLLVIINKNSFINSKNTITINTSIETVSGTTTSDTTIENNKCDNELANKINPEILVQMGLKTLENFGISSYSMIEPFKIIPSVNKSNELSFKKISSNKLYYVFPCNYIMDDCFYDSL